MAGAPGPRSLSGTALASDRTPPSTATVVAYYRSLSARPFSQGDCEEAMYSVLQSSLNVLWRRDAPEGARPFLFFSVRPKAHRLASDRYPLSTETWSCSCAEISRGGRLRSTPSLPFAFQLPRRILSHPVPSHPIPSHPCLASPAPSRLGSVAERRSAGSRVVPTRRAAIAAQVTEVPLAWPFAWPFATSSPVSSFPCVRAMSVSRHQQPSEIIGAVVASAWNDSHFTTVVLRLRDGKQVILPRVQMLSIDLPPIAVSPPGTPDSPPDNGQARGRSRSRPHESGQRTPEEEIAEASQQD